MTTRHIRVRCPLCGLVVDPRRFEEDHKLDFKVIEFYGSPKGRQGGGLRHLWLDIFKLPGGSELYDRVVGQINSALKRLWVRFQGRETYSLEVPLFAPSIEAGFSNSVETQWR